MSVKARIYINLKNGVLDPQGKAIESSLKNLNFNNVAKVTQGKIIDVEFTEVANDDLPQKIDEMCKSLLVNTVIENYSYEIL